MRPITTLTLLAALHLVTPPSGHAARSRAPARGPVTSTGNFGAYNVARRGFIPWKLHEVTNFGGHGSAAVGMAEDGWARPPSKVELEGMRSYIHEGVAASLGGTLPRGVRITTGRFANYSDGTVRVLATVHVKGEGRAQREFIFQIDVAKLGTAGLNRHGVVVDGKPPVRLFAVELEQDHLIPHRRP